MKANGSKRKIFDAVDMMTADAPQAETGNGLQNLPANEQALVAEKNAAINEKSAKSIRAAAGELTEDKLKEILHPVKESAPAKAVNIKIPAEAEEKYFSGMKAKERADLVMKALDAWFAGKEAADVQQ